VRAPAGFSRLWARARVRPLAAIRAFCIECMGYQRAEVEKCTAPECPLYQWRFGRRPAGLKRAPRALAGVCKKDTPKG